MDLLPADKVTSRKKKNTGVLSSVVVHAHDTRDWLLFTSPLQGGYGRSRTYLLRVERAREAKDLARLHLCFNGSPGRHFLFVNSRVFSRRRW